MSIIRIGDLVREALIVSGCDPTLVNQLDNHSSIKLELHDLPSIIINHKDEDVFVCSFLSNDSAFLTSPVVKNLLQELHGHDSARGNQLILNIEEGSLVLKAMIHPDYLEDGKSFAYALNEFFTRVEYFYGEILR